MAKYYDFDNYENFTNDDILEVTWTYEGLHKLGEYFGKIHRKLNDGEKVTLRPNNLDNASIFGALLLICGKLYECKGKHNNG